MMKNKDLHHTDHFFGEALQGPGELLAVQGHSNASVGVNIVLLLISFQLSTLPLLKMKFLVNLSKCFVRWHDYKELNFQNIPSKQKVCF